jgi:hypothetical protein
MGAAAKARAAIELNQKRILYVGESKSGEIDALMRTFNQSIVYAVVE